ncbi:MAG: alpha/beta hydrolase [Acidobacteria bacterium]|nr:alpha/beta hydrolase [Acidobacteriota bacterium]
MQAALTFLAIVVIFLLVLRLMENSMIYFPVKYPEGFWQPAEFGVAAEDWFFTTEDGVKLHGWYASQEGARQTLVWCHGNAGNISHRLDHLKILLERVKVNVFILGYRGYGRSKGTPSEDGLYLDAQAAYDYLVSQKNVEASQIILYGQSLGGAVVIDLALKRPCAGLIIESSFTSAKDMATHVYPFLPVHYFMGVRFDSAAKIARLHAPVLIMHGAQDEVVPYELGQKLFAAANEPKEFYPIQRATHNDPFIIGGEEYYAKIREFIQRLPDQR